MGLFNSDNGDGKPFAHAIPGAEQLATTLKDTVGAFASGLGVKATQSTCVCEGCGAPLSGARHETVQCPYCDRHTQLP